MRSAFGNKWPGVNVKCYEVSSYVLFSFSITFKYTFGIFLFGCIVIVTNIGKINAPLDFQMPLKILLPL